MGQKKKVKTHDKDGFCQFKLFLYMYFQNSGFTLQKKSLNVTFGKMAALVSAILWIHFCTVEGIKRSVIQLYCQWGKQPTSLRLFSSSKQSIYDFMPESA